MNPQSPFDQDRAAVSALKRRMLNMNVTLNGQEESIADGLSVAALLTERDLQPVRVAVEINERLVPRKMFDQTTIQPGDRIEIVTFVGGG